MNPLQIIKCLFSHHDYEIIRQKGRSDQKITLVFNRCKLCHSNTLLDVYYNNKRLPSFDEIENMVFGNGWN